MGLVFLAIVGGGCSASSVGGAGVTTSYRDEFIDAVGDVTDAIQAIANSFMSNRSIANAINDVVSQYVVFDLSSVSELMSKAIGWTMLSGDVTVEAITGNASFDKAMLVDIWAGNHITVVNGRVTSFAKNQGDFQLTITSSDSHVTKLTVKPQGSTYYWQAFSVASNILNDVLGKLSGQSGYLLFAKTYASAEIEITYNGVKLLDGTISVSYPGKNTGDKVYLNTPHTATFALTLYPQNNKSYSVGIDLTRTTVSTGTNSANSNSTLNMYRRTGSTTQTILNATAGISATMAANALQPTAASVTALDLNIADKIRIAESNSLDLLRLMALYVTGTSATEEQIKSNVANINTILSNAGLSLYLNKSSNKAGDIRALAGKLGNYNHARFGIQFTGSNETELVRDIVNPDDLQTFRVLFSKVSGQVQTLVRLLSGTGIMNTLSSNEIIKLIFEDLFGTN